VNNDHLVRIPALPNRYLLASPALLAHGLLIELSGVGWGVVGMVVGIAGVVVCIAGVVVGIVSSCHVMRGKKRSVR
jgi:hypothetical protein